MKTSPAGIDLIKRFEGCELEAYRDIAGIWTIGYGHTGPDVVQGLVWTHEKAAAVLVADLGAREAQLGHWSFLWDVHFNENEFSALVSFIFNVGFDAFKGSTAARWLREGKPRERVAEALTWWNKATVNGVLREVTGLTRRRRAEAGLFLRPVHIQPAIPVGLLSSPDYSSIHHRASNARAEKETRPLMSFLPRVWRVA